VRIGNCLLVDHMIERIAVIGSGTMGAAIAGQVANAGMDVLLLDLPGQESRNSVAEAALTRLLESDPPALIEKSVAKHITVGNIEDDFDKLAKMDWIVEAVVERLDIKQALYRRLDSTVSDQCIVTSNTSTIPIKLLVEGMPDSFQERFAITHYFNPVRYMRLLELVRGEKTRNDVMDVLADFNDRQMGKGVVPCADTPGFLGNRVGVFALQVGIDEATKLQLPIETADALMGRPMGIPKTGVFGLYDLIGVDLMADVVRSLRSILPAHDAFHAVGAENPMINQMIDSGYTGAKGLGGFYASIDGVEMTKDMASGNYRARVSELPQRAINAATAIAEQREALTDLVKGDGSEADFCRNVLARVLGYSASLLGEVTDNPQAIDDAMKLGFNWVRGPFEMIDALGAEFVVGVLTDLGESVPQALQNKQLFYVVQEDALCVRRSNGELKPVSLPQGVVRFHMQKQTLQPIASNDSASVYSIANDLRLIEFHSKANALTDASMEMVAAAVNNPGKGIIVHNDAQHYSAGVDLNAFLALIEKSDWDGIDAFLERFQMSVKALKYSKVPVVGAPSGLSLGGGCEVLLHCDQLVMHANIVMGLVESSVGLIPSGGGVKETYLRWYRKLGNWDDAAWKTWMNVGYGATGTSPELAQKLGYYREEKDQQVINRDRLYAGAVDAVTHLQSGYTPPDEPLFKLVGGDMLQRMRTFMEEGVAKKLFTPHDLTVAMQVATIVCADDGQAVEVDEDHMYQREREAFVRLAKTAESRARIEHLLAGKGTLRN